MSLRRAACIIGPILTFSVFLMFVLVDKDDFYSLPANELEHNVTPPWYSRFVMRGKQLHSSPPTPVDRATTVRPVHVPLWPDEDPGDRVIQQLTFVPPKVSSRQSDTEEKRILLYNGIENWSGIPLNEGREYFRKSNCSVDSCSLTLKKANADSVDAIIFKNGITKPITRKCKEQIWILYLLESPYHSVPLINSSKVFNWTSTYRHDSDIPSLYTKFVLYNPDVTTLPVQENFAANRTHKVAWFVSNCNARNDRLHYARMLSKYISVDIYGKCGHRKCPRSASHECMKRISRDYKFYLSFENSNCRDYITEKLFINALSYNLLPIVMGAPKEDYERAAPHHSFIHVDDFDSPKHLADYLHQLDANDTLYNEYFAWKRTGELIYDDRYLCRVCAMLHTKYETKVYDDIETWWRGPGICTTGSWKKN